jgi:putative ABC transport system permease protein
MTALLDTFAVAIATLRANPLRSALTLLGMVIAAATVLATASLTNGLRLKLRGDFAQLGAGAFEVTKLPSAAMGPIDSNEDARRADLTREQGEALRALPHVGYVSVEEWGEPEVLSTAERATRREIEVGGGGLEAAVANNAAIARGRFLSDTDVLLARRVVFVGADVADVLFPRMDPIGQRVRIRGAAFEVIGVAERRGSMMGLSKDGFAIVPWTAYETVLGKRRSVRIVVGASDPAGAPLAMDEVIQALRRLRGVKPHEENGFEVFSSEAAAEAFENLARAVGVASSGVCALALLVGGIGIMNIMLVSVTERTREIGVRKALGARRSRILSQFLAESVTLSGLGGIAGVLAGGALAVGARELFGAPAVVPPWAAVLSLGSALVAGLLFGIYPAARASKLDPVEAMRSD